MSKNLEFDVKKLLLSQFQGKFTHWQKTLFIFQNYKIEALTLFESTIVNRDSVFTKFFSIWLKKQFHRKTLVSLFTFFLVQKMSRNQTKLDIFQFHEIFLEYILIFPKITNFTQFHRIYCHKPWILQVNFLKIVKISLISRNFFIILHFSWFPVTFAVLFWKGDSS